MRDRSRLVNGGASIQNKTTPEKIQKLLEAAQNWAIEIKPGDTILDNWQPSQAQKNEAALAIQDIQITPVSIIQETQELLKKLRNK